MKITGGLSLPLGLFVFRNSFLFYLGYDHFVTLHAKLGLGVIIVLTINVVMGVISHLLYNPKRLSPPCWPDKVHCTL
jgi:hypothetical protein